MAEFVCCQIARGGKEKRSERSHRLALPVSTKKCFLDDFFRRFTGVHEAPNVPMQGLAAVCEEPDERLGVRLRSRRHCPIFPLIYPTPLRGSAATFAIGMGGFVRSRVVCIAAVRSGTP